MRKSVFISFFILINFQIFSQINQGDVLINSFDPAIGKINYNMEMVVLVNNTSSLIDLNGYEIVCYKFDGITQTDPYWRFTSSTTLLPYGFLLITNNTNNVHGVSADLVRYGTRGYIDYDGYLIFRKINATDSSDFIDIVKYQSILLDKYPFTGVPPNSGITLDMPWFVLDENYSPDEYATRGGVSGNINSINYSNYGMMGQSTSDFIKVFETNTLYVENSNSPPLPVELSSFTAKVLRDGRIKLDWRTETEVDNYGFNIERSINEGEWSTIGFVEGYGNSNSPKQYNYTDEDLFAGGSKFQYRLKQLDTDGQFEYSDVVEVEIVPTKIELSQNYPNPFNPSTTIRFSLPKETQLKINIYNVLGELVETLAEGTYKVGYHKLTFNASALSSGTYIYRIESTEFVQTKKMLLLK